MPEFCTCGARLPDDALFCHKCGKPQRELPVVGAPDEPAEAPPVAPPIQTPPPIPGGPPIGFRNGRAVRIAAVLGPLAFLLSAMANLLTPIFLPAAGFMASYFYQARSGESLSPISGARLGWITGIFGFLLGTVLTTIAAALLTNPEVAGSMREQLKLRGMPEAEVQNVFNLLTRPGDVLMALLMMFVIFTSLSALGGALGARLSARWGARRQ